MASPLFGARYMFLIMMLLVFIALEVGFSLFRDMRSRGVGRWGDGRREWGGLMGIGRGGDLEMGTGDGGSG